MTAQEYFDMFKKHIVAADMDLEDILSQLYLMLTTEMWKTLDYKSMNAVAIRDHFDSYNKIWNEFADIFEAELKTLPGMIQRDFFLKLLEKELKMDFKKAGLA
jgi:hypothetical protein